MQYEIWKDEEDEGTITVLHEGQLYAANTDHPAWDEIVKGAIAEDSAIIDLFDRTAVIARHFDKLSERVTVGHGRVQFDGNEVDTALTQHILRTLADSPEVIDYMPFVNFLEKVETNPNEHSREQLYEFLRAHDFTITLEGDFVAYKGVDSEGRSITSGNATVDGNVIRGKIPNEVGSIIEMPRLSVEHNPNQDCSTGLHAATHSFAQGFGSKVLSILVNPRDVVSVPAHGNAEKIRVCRYRVLEIVEDSPYQGTVIDEDEFDEDIDLNEETDEDPSYLDDNIDDEDLGAIGPHPVGTPVVTTATAKNTQSPLDQEPTYQKLMEMLTDKASVEVFTTTGILNWLDTICGVVTTKDSLRRFKQRHGLS